MNDSQGANRTRPGSSLQPQRNGPGRMVLNLRGSEDPVRGNQRRGVWCSSYGIHRHQFAQRSEFGWAEWTWNRTERGKKGRTSMACFRPLSISDVWPASHPRTRTSMWTGSESSPGKRCVRSGRRGTRNIVRPSSESPEGFKYSIDPQSERSAVTSRKAG